VRRYKALFDRVAESDAAKALDLLAPLAEFVISKLARTTRPEARCMSSGASL
jgi:hypothetical protein